MDIPPLKKAKYIGEKYNMMEYQYQVLMAQYQHQSAYHGFRPWTSSIGASAKHLPHLPFSVSTTLPYLSQEPPILQNPERVVRISECERYEQSYQPNVALAPRNGSKTSSAGNKMDTEHGEYESSERDRPLAMDVKIKEERPQTPLDESHSPESCITSGVTVANTPNNIDSTPNAPPIR